MDPFATDGELMTMQNAFHAGDFATVMSADMSTLSDSNRIAALIYHYRSLIASGQAQKALDDLKKDASVQEGPAEFGAVEALALLSKGRPDEAVKTIEKVMKDNANNSTVQVLGGTILHAVGKTEEAIALLGQHEGNLEAVALTVQIYLHQNRTDLALKEVQGARKWAQDSLLVNIAESWLGLRIGGEQYQSAFYVFEELAQSPPTISAGSIESTSVPTQLGVDPPGTKALLCQAIAELHLGRLPEAQAALENAMQKSPNNADTLANAIVLGAIMGKSFQAEEQEKLKTLKKLSNQHPFLTDLAEKDRLFDTAATKYTAKVAAS